MRRACSVLLFGLLGTTPLAAQSPDLVAHRLLGNSRITAVREDLDKNSASILADTRRFVTNPSSAATIYLEAIQKLGLTEVKKNEDGSIVGWLRGAGNGKAVLLAVRLPRSAPNGKPGQMRSQGAQAYAPGIQDARSLAVVLGLIRAVRAARIDVSSDILVVASSGEQSMQHLLESDGYKDQIHAVVALQAAKANVIINSAPGLRRYRFRFSGAKADSAVAALSVEAEKRGMSYSLASGPENAGERVIDLECRAASLEDLDRMSAEIQTASQGIAPNGGDTRTEITLLREELPARTHVSLNIVQLASAIARESGVEPTYEMAVTEASAAMRLGIPAIALGFGPGGGTSYGPEEWISLEQSSTVQAETDALVALLSIAGLR